MSNRQKKKQAAEEFSARREQEKIDLQRRIEERRAFEATPEGQAAIRMKRKRVVQILTIGAAISVMGGTT